MAYHYSEWSYRCVAQHSECCSPHGEQLPPMEHQSIFHHYFFFYCLGNSGFSSCDPSATHQIHRSTIKQKLNFYGNNLNLRSFFKITCIRENFDVWFFLLHLKIWSTNHHHHFHQITKLKKQKATWKTSLLVGCDLIKSRKLTFCYICLWENLFWDILIDVNITSLTQPLKAYINVSFSRSPLLKNLSKVYGTI